MESNYLLFHEHMNYSMLYELHALGMDLQSPLTRYNQEHDDLSGECLHHLEPSLTHLKHLGKVTGFSAINYYAKDVLELIASLDTNQRNDYFDALNDDLQRLGHQAVPHYDGSVTYFDWENIPKIYLFSNPREPLTPVYIPSFGFNQNEEKHHSTTDNDDDKYQSALDPASHNHLKPEHMLQARLQQEADDDKPEEPETKPSKQQPIVDDALIRQRQQQAEQQQADAVNDDDDDYDNKKKRERRQQRQRRTKQRLTQEQQQDNEARIIRERCLAAEKKYNEELKHPTKPYNNGNRSTNKPEPDGPSM